MKRLFKGEKKEPSKRMIGGYELGATLGVGGYAKVKLGVDKATGQKVALKILLADAKGNISDSKRKQTERAIELLSKVKHENVLQLVSAEKDTMYPEADGRETPCMLMVLEHAGNGELFDYLMFTGYFDEPIARSYFKQLLDGLDAIHSKGFAHRDLKPENLLLDENFTLKIADFGFATNFKSEDGKSVKMKTACGTKGYLAPEVLKGKKYEQSVDIFAAGIILFITYAGFPPFNDAIPTDWWWARLESGWKERAKGKLMDKKGEWSKHGLFWAAHERTRQFPRDLKDFLLKIMHYDPTQRPTIEQIRNEKHGFYTLPAKLWGRKEKQPKKALEDSAPSWYQGEIKPTVELGRYLERRSKTVRTERAKKIQDQVKEMSAGQQEKYRGLKVDPWNPEQEDWMAYRLRTYYDPIIKEFDPEGQFGKYELESFSAGTFASTPFYFFTKQPPAVVAACFHKAAIGRKGATHLKFEPEETTTIIRAKTDSEVPLETEFAVRQYTYVDKYIVSCKRLNGDPLAFKAIIEYFWDSTEVMEIMDPGEETIA